MAYYTYSWMIYVGIVVVVIFVKLMIYLCVRRHLMQRRLRQQQAQGVVYPGVYPTPAGAQPPSYPPVPSYSGYQPHPSGPEQGAPPDYYVVVAEDRKKQQVQVAQQPEAQPPNPPHF